MARHQSVIAAPRFSSAYRSPVGHLDFRTLSEAGTRVHDFKVGAIRCTPGVCGWISAVVSGARESQTLSQICRTVRVTSDQHCTQESSENNILPTCSNLLETIFFLYTSTRLPVCRAPRAIFACDWMIPTA